MAESTAVKSIQCPQCLDKSCHNMTVYSDGHGYCHKCGLRITDNGDIIGVEYKTGIEVSGGSKQEFIGSYQDIVSRGLSKEVCEQIGCMTGKHGNIECYAFLYDKGVKIRYKDEKKFRWIEGKGSDCSMFGLDKAKDYNKPIVLTEGEFDTIACYEVGYQACSLRHGAGDVEKAIGNNMSELIIYPEIWLGFDNDEEGRKATKKAIEILPKDKIIKIINWGGFKDANEAFLYGNPHNYKEQHLGDILKEILEITSKEIEVEMERPKGLEFSNEIEFNDLRNEVVRSIEIPAPKLAKFFGGFDYGCIYTLLAGVGIGKTTLLTEWGMFWYNKGLKVANLFYEESSRNRVTALRYIALKYNIPIGELRRNRQLLTEDQWKEAEKEFNNTDRLAFLSKDSEKNSSYLLKYIEYLVRVKKFDVILVDHISYIIGRSGVSSHGERRDIDELFYELQELTDKLQCITIMVSHVVESKKKENKSYSDGEIPDLYSGRGSKVLAQAPDGVIAFARNMNNEYNQSILSTYGVKNRWGSTLGKADSYIYFESTGRMSLLGD